MAADGSFPTALAPRGDEVGADARGLIARPVAVWWQSLARFALYAAPFFAVGLGYEILRRVIHLRGAIHVGDLFDLEARLFPVHTSEGTRALSEVIALRQSTLLDLIAGASYVLFLVEVFGVAAAMFFRARPKMLAISLGFLLLNLTGWLVWLAYPAAPPWYVDLYGKGPAVLDAASNPAGLLRLDALIGVPIAKTFYSGSANVFGAMPSLHVGYAVLVAWVVFPLRGAWRTFTLLFALSIAFSAVYLRHHYILDVLAGALLALPVAWFSVRAAERLDHFQAFSS